MICLGNKGLFIWVEGDDDERFFERVIKSHFDTEYDYVKIISYEGDRYKEEKKKEKITSFFKAITSMKKSVGYTADYLFVTDLDTTPCATRKKQEIKEILKGIDEKRILVVKNEIEGWYIAGLNDRDSKKLGVKCFHSTNKLTKEAFNKIMPRRFASSRIDFMQEILNCFCLETAKKKNESFKYFIGKYL